MTTNAWEGVIDYDAPGPEGDYEDEPAAPEVKLYPYAGGIRRYVGYAVWDCGLLLTTMSVLEGHIATNLLAWLALTVGPLYFIVGYRIGGTLGHWITGTRVVKDTDASQHIGWIRAVLRFLVLEVEVLTILPLFFAYTNPQRRTLHDKVAGSVVIRVRRNWREMSQKKGLGL